MIFKLILLISLCVWILNVIWKTEKEISNKIDKATKDINLFSDSIFNNEDDDNGQE